MIWYWLGLLTLIAVAAALQGLGILRPRRQQNSITWLIAGLVLLGGGWMAFDGFHFLVTGDYVTPATGPSAGQLGPWARVVEGVGLRPRSTLVGSLFAGYGILYLTATGTWVYGSARARWAVLLVAILGLWYVPFGALLNIIVILLIAFGFRPG